jgi:hypothetical protein
MDKNMLICERRIDIEIKRPGNLILGFGKEQNEDSFLLGYLQIRNILRIHKYNKKNSTEKNKIHT